MSITYRKPFGKLFAFCSICTSTRCVFTHGRIEFDIRQITRTKGITLLLRSRSLAGMRSMLLPRENGINISNLSHKKCRLGGAVREYHVMVDLSITTNHYRRITVLDETVSSGECLVPTAEVSEKSQQYREKDRQCQRGIRARAEY